MKRITLALVLVLFISSSAVQKRNPLDPWGMVRIDDNFWVNQTEVLTKDWINYFNIVTRDSGFYKARKIRPYLINNWIIPSSRENLRRQRVFNNQPTSLRNLQMAPITYITFEQAQAYCKWRSDLMNQRLRELGITKTIRFRLPTEEDWKMILAYNRKWEETKLKRSNRYIRRIHENRKQVAVFQVPSTLRDRRVYQLYHNVSEMTAQEGVAIGMNNSNFEINGDLDGTINYNNPSALLGFRCIAEYID